ncbi:TetR/AcrR family transcriptional regulator [Alteripontixanthobacter muriae]|uniref:TetR/AcrR family transcriptional regulator n=1 Tax=Alteripontixanthobacter muriae TaxID=2705546 RepID=UPI0019D52008|nr:TetR/AcrR family transcriptional regulator [Alteripontixanthobacter muriae]
MPAALSAACAITQKEKRTMTKQPSVLGRRRSAANKVSRASYQARRQEIRDAAIAVFNRQGFANASLSKVAQELEIDRATLYYYFSSKEDLFDEIVGAVLERNHDLAREIAVSAISPRRKLRDLITAMMISYDENYPLLYIYIREDLRQVSDARSVWSSRMRELNRGIERAFIDIIEEGQKDGTFRKAGSADVVARGILGMVNWTHRWHRPGKGSTAREIGQTFSEIALAGLESPY